MKVTEWLLNDKTHELEWEVYWYSNQYSWEPNSHFGKFNSGNLIFAFLTGTVAAATLPVVPPQ